ncbi:MAG TPA: hypothetical protein VJT50_02310 [Pyrinomonadaceae bacterium]|nr:hypothetical protein [Pyrinomonadaceae bacterium]
MTNFRRILIWAIAGVLGMIVLLAIVARIAFGVYLKSDAFRRKIQNATAHALKAEGEFTPLQLNGGNFYSDRFVARGNPGTFFSQLQADQIRADFDWRGLLHRAWKIDELNVQQLDVRFAERSPRPPTEAAPTPGELRPVPKTSGWKLDLRRVKVEKSSWHWGASDQPAGNITGSTLILTPTYDAWLIDAGGGQISQKGWPELLIESAKLRYTSSSLFVTESVLRNGVGRIVVSGEIDFNRAADLRAQIDDLPIGPLLPADWRYRLNGKLAGTARVVAPLPDGTLHVEGSMRLVDGHVEALPILNQIATFTRTDRFRNLVLNKASMNFTRDAKMFTGKDLVLESEGLLRVEGAFTVVNDQIDGVLQIGVTAASLQWLPGSQARVFTVAHDGYYWTPLRVTGPVEHPVEDLTPRLVAAAAGELLENSQDTLMDAAKTILDLIPR